MSDRPKWLQDWIAYFWRTTEQEKADIAKERNDLAALRVELTEFKQEMRHKMTVVDDAITGLKTEVANDIAAMKADFATQLANAQSGMVSISDVAASINQATSDLHAKYAPVAPVATDTTATN